MKKLLIASTALVATAGIAAADNDNFSFSGSSGFGLVYNGAVVNPDFYMDLDVEMRGETDGGLEFGADIGGDAVGYDGMAGAATAAALDVPTVFVSGTFGKVSVGGVDNAPDAVVGRIADVGYSGLGVDNVAEFMRGLTAANVLYEGSFSDFTVAASFDATGGTNDFGLAAGYSFGDYNVAAGYENVGGTDVFSVSAGGTFGDFAANALYAGVAAFSTYGLDASYTFGATTVTAAYGGTSTGANAFGIGASYDLGGGASLDGGVARTALGATVADLGINMEF